MLSAIYLSVGRRPKQGIKVIEILIDGVKSNGNQEKRVLRETAKLSQLEYLKVFQIVKSNVEKCILGQQSEKVPLKRADELEVVLNRGGFVSKEVTFSKQDLPESLSDHGKMLKNEKVPEKGCYFTGHVRNRFC